MGGRWGAHRVGREAGGGVVDLADHAGHELGVELGLALLRLGRLEAQRIAVLHALDRRRHEVVREQLHGGGGGGVGAAASTQNCSRAGLADEATPRTKKERGVSKGLDDVPVLPARLPQPFAYAHSSFAVGLFVPLCCSHRPTLGRATAFVPQLLDLVSPPFVLFLVLCVVLHT